MAQHRSVIRVLHVAAAAAAFASPAVARGTATEYAFNLATFSGIVRSDGSVVRYDPKENELYAIDHGIVRIFGKTGMQIHSFGEDRRIYPVQDLAALEDGDLLVLSARTITRCNDRGEPRSEWRLRDLPAALASFRPESIRAVNGKVFLASHATRTVVVADPSGAFIRSHDLRALLAPFATVDRRRRGGAAQRPPREVEVRGFGVAPDESLLFTEPTGFRAFVISPGGEVRTFGQRGGAPGMFNVAVAIDADGEGKLYVVDILKSAVMVFDKELNFLREFGYRGGQPGNLVAPVQVAAGGGQAFVSQMGRRGVAVYRVQDASPTENESDQGQQ
jgi:DNA-binding beta-propeller fold protein YncE